MNHLYNLRMIDYLPRLRQLQAQRELDSKAWAIGVFVIALLVIAIFKV